MKRPAFQFYTGDWQKNAKLRRCSHGARGAWVDVLCLLHDSEEYGVLRWPLKDIAQAAGAPMPLLRELVSKGVLKGAEKGAEPYIYTPRHAGKDGDPVTLVAVADGPCWYSSRFVRDEWVRVRRGAGTRFGDEDVPQPNTKPKAAREAAPARTERARLRASVLAKTDGACWHCQCPLVGAWEIDHLMPRAKGGSNLFANLVPSCVPCNQDKSDSLPDDWTRSPTRRVGEGKGDGPSSSSSPSGSSEANASDAAAASSSGEDSKPKAKTPEDMAKAELWRAGKALLLENDVPKDQCGTFLGVLVNDYGALLVLDAVRAAVRETPADAREYLKATCQRLKGERAAAPQHAVTVASSAPDKTAAYLADQRRIADEARNSPLPEAVQRLRSTMKRETA